MEQKIILETERLVLREMRAEDEFALRLMLQDPEVMYAYNGAFTDEETRGWLNNQFARYAEYGFGLWAVVLKENGQMIGQCGITWQNWKDERVLEIGYLFQKAYWHHGYAAEAARACRAYAFDALDAECVHSIIRETNAASRNVAERNGMKVVDQWVKHYRGEDMPHVLYRVRRDELTKAAL